MSKQRVVVTAGGTKEPIDDVRFITNFSTGQFGYTIARAFDAFGYEVSVLAPMDVLYRAGSLIENAQFINFSDTESLKSELEKLKSPDIVIHAAAVSDYRPIRTSGKISSDQDELVIRMERTPKILDGLRNLYGQSAFIVGFKLLSGVSRNELVEKAMAQNKRAHLNLTVANDLQNLGGGMHPVILVTAEGGAIDLYGTREQVAVRIVEFIRKRSQVQWYKSVLNLTNPDPSKEEKELFAKALQFAQKSGLLYDTSGNLSMRQGYFMRVTPRQLDKSQITPDQAVTAMADHDRNVVWYNGAVKSSIDTGVSDYIYRRMPQIKYLLHFHTPWGTAAATTSFPYPCGAQEEAVEIMSKLQGQDIRGEFAIELLHHGFLVGLQEDGIERLEKEWDEVVAEFGRHLEEVNQPQMPEGATLRPIFANTAIVGVFMDHPEGGVTYLSERSRGLGVGRKVVDQIIHRQKPIVTIDECGVVEFYQKFGFTGEKNPVTGKYHFMPPMRVGSDPLFARMDEWKLP